MTRMDALEAAEEDLQKADDRIRGCLGSLDRILIASKGTDPTPMLEKVVVVRKVLQDMLEDARKIGLDLRIMTMAEEYWPPVGEKLTAVGEDHHYRCECGWSGYISDASSFFECQCGKKYNHNGAMWVLE